MTVETILITGAAGRIGRMLRTRMARPGRILRLLDVVPPEPAAAGEPVAVLEPASVTDLDAVRAAMSGADAVVHLGGIPVEDAWDRILEVNIDGTRAVLEAARLEGVRRVVLASSNHAVGFERRSQAPPDGLPAATLPRPDTYYGVSKAAMEALGSLYHDRFGIDVVCLRIGACEPTPPDTAALPIWLSPDDMARLAEAAIGTPSPGYRIVWGISRNTRAWWSLREGAEIGYEPQDDSETYADQVPQVPAELVPDQLGGLFCNAPLGEPM